MAQKLIFSNTKNTFETKLNQGQVNNTDIAFIKDSKQIWTHDTYFKCSGLNSNSNVLWIGTSIPAGDIQFSNNGTHNQQQVI